MVCSANVVLGTIIIAFQSVIYFFKKNVLSAIAVHLEYLRSCKQMVGTSGVAQLPRHQEVDPVGGRIDAKLELVGSIKK